MATEAGAGRSGFSLLRRSISVKFLVLFLLFSIVPFIIYDQLQQAYLQHRTLLLNSIQEQGRLVAIGIAPWLPSETPKELRATGKLLERYDSRQVSIKLLWRPAATLEDSTLYYIGSAPAVPAAYLDEEVRRFREMGVISNVLGSCSGGGPVASRYVNPAGGHEILTAITPILKGEECWIVITSASEEVLGEDGLGTPYWQRREVVLSGVIYLVVLAVTLSLLLSVWGNVRRFGWLARRLRTARERSRRFVDLNRVPELAGVAQALDDLVSSLRRSAESLRESSEERAHAFKTPIATIAQSVQPIRNTLGDSDGRAGRALKVIERSLERLEELLVASHRMDEENAKLIDPPREPVDLAALVRQTASGYDQSLKAQDSAIEIRASVPDKAVIVEASEDLIETVLENLLDNAISYAPANGCVEVAVTASGGAARVTVADNGPGMDPAMLNRAFERYFSTRAGGRRGDDGGEAGAPSHFGIGLWVVRRNIEALGGRVALENRNGAGLVVRVDIPLAR
ncbi:MAG TPA: HAMP domain-containing sensor histidine kinase [Alphaproteobacteria bacterium]